MKVLQFFEDAPYSNMFLKNLFKTFKTVRDVPKMIDLKGRAPHRTHFDNLCDISGVTFLV